MDKDILIQELFKRIGILEKRLAIVEAENQGLKKRLAKYETPKNSNNSSIPLQRMKTGPNGKACTKRQTLFLTALDLKKQMGSVDY